MVHFNFFYSFNATPVPPPLICSTCLTILLNIFYVIHQELFFMFILKKFVKLQTVVEFFWKSRWLEAFKLSEVEPHILRYFTKSYNIESLQVIDKCCCIPVKVFLNVAYISYKLSYKKWNVIPFSLHFSIAMTKLGSGCLLNFHCTIF